jgi:uridine kinase
VKRPLLVAIVGGSGSGKSWLADELADALAPDVGRVCLDDFYRDRSHLSPGRRDRLNFDHPRAIDWRRVETALRQLLRRRPARVPGYDFATHSRISRLRVVKPKRVILVDGLWLLQRRSVRKLFDFSIFLGCSARVRLARRLERDRRARGRSVKSVRRQFRETVQPMHSRYVAPQTRFADVVLRRQCGIQEVRRVARILRERSAEAESPYSAVQNPPYSTAWRL